VSDFARGVDRYREGQDYNGMGDRSRWSKCAAPKLYGAEAVCVGGTRVCLPAVGSEGSWGRGNGQVRVGTTMANRDQTTCLGCSLTTDFT
jgi:hypothetical protein